MTYLLTLILASSLFTISLYGSSETVKQATKQQQKQISIARYVTGGIVGSIPIMPVVPSSSGGFDFLPIGGLGGLGHLIQGRWLSDGGWIHTTAQAALLASLPTFGFLYKYSLVSWHPILVIIGVVITYAGLKVYEIIDVWRLDPSKHKIADKTSPTLLVHPVLNKDGVTGVQVAMSLSLR